MMDPTLNKRQKTGKAISFYWVYAVYVLCIPVPAAMNDVLKAKKYSEVTVNLFSK